jgi:tRNA G18 (ribose-2'-O)-methylase SpoU
MTTGSRTDSIASQTGAVEAVRVDRADDPLLDRVRLLRSPDRILRATGVVVMEGFTMVERWLGRGRSMRQLVVTPAQWTRLEHLVRPGDVVVVERDVLAEAAGFDLHRGVVGFVDEPSPPAWSQVVTSARTLVVVEGMNDAENLGAVMRSVWALGADALVLDPTTLDPFGRRVVRVSMGAALELPVVRAPTWPQALDDLRRHGVQVMGLTPRADAVSWAAAAVGGDERVALLVGAEGPGLSHEALACVDVAVRIPMRPGVDSLNVAHAAAIALAGLQRAPTMPS